MSQPAKGSFDELIATAYAALSPLAATDPTRWERHAVETLLPDLLARYGAPQAFLDWAREHRRWSFSVDEAASEVCAKPREAAVHVLKAIVTELIEEES